MGNKSSVFLHFSSSQDLWPQQSSLVIHWLSPWVAGGSWKKCVWAWNQCINARGSNSHKSHLSSTPNAHVQIHGLSCPCLAARIFWVPHCIHFSQEKLWYDHPLTLHKTHLTSTYSFPRWAASQPASHSQKGQGEPARSHSGIPMRWDAMCCLVTHCTASHRHRCKAACVLSISKPGRDPHSMNPSWRLLPPQPGTGLVHLEQQRKGQGWISKLSLFPMAFPSEFPGIYY